MTRTQETRKCRLIAAAAGLVLSLLVGATSAQAFVVIDDFNVGSYNETATETTVTMLAVGPSGSGHVISANRRFEFRPFGTGPLTLQLGTGGGTTMRNWSETGSGNIELEWRWGFPADLTEGGGVDTICINVLSTPPSGGALFISFEDTGSLHGQAKSMPDPGLYKFPLSDWLVDMTQLVAISIHTQFGGHSGAMWEIDDIRTKGQGTVTPNLLGNWTLVETNPLPSSPCIFTTLDQIGNPVYQTQVGWQDIQVDGSVPALHGVWSDTPYGNGETCAITMNTDFDGGYIYGWYGYYEMFIDFADAGGNDVEIAYPPDPVHTGEGTRSISLPIHVMTRDNNGAQNGDSRILMTLNLGPNQPAEMQNPMVTPVYSKAQSTLTGFRIAWELITQDVILDSEPVYEIEWASEWEEISIATDVAGAADTESVPFPGLASLAATPSVTKGATELRAARPFSANEAVQVFDVRGRLVRTLSPGTGATAIAWDGRGADGASASAGVYFARRTNDRDSAPARITLIR